MHPTTAPSHASLGYHAVSDAALLAYADRDLGAAIALAAREAHRERADYLRRGLGQALRRLVAWPRRQVRQVLRFSH